MREKLTLIVTTRCNMACRHCLRGHAPEPTDLSTSVFKRLLGEAKLMGLRHIALTGGEPALHPQYDDIVARIVARGFTWSVVTNGSLYPAYQPSIQRFGDKLGGVYASLDGAREATHDAIRQHGSYAKVLETIGRCKAQAVPVRILFTVTSANIGEVEDAAQLAARLKADSFIVLGTIPTSENCDLQLTREQRVEVFLLLQGLKRTMRLPLAHNTSLWALNDPDRFCPVLTTYEPAVNPWGEVVFCCDTTGHGAVLGSLHDHCLFDLCAAGEKTAAWLRERRREMLSRKAYFRDFNSCHFCNALLAGAQHDSASRARPRSRRPAFTPRTDDHHE